jgi:hypothetical protein
MMCYFKNGFYKGPKFQYFAKWSSLWVIDRSLKQICNFISKKNLKGAQIPNISHIWKMYLSFKMVKQDKYPKYNGSNILLCPTRYCVKQNTVSTLAFKLDLFNFPLLTCCSRIMLCSVYPFFYLKTWSKLYFVVKRNTVKPV